MEKNRRVVYETLRFAMPKKKIIMFRAALPFIGHATMPLVSIDSIRLIKTPFDSPKVFNRVCLTDNESLDLLSDSRLAIVSAISSMQLF